MATLRLALLVFLVANAAPAVAEEAALTVGDELPRLGLEDQHDVAHPIGSDTKLLLFTRDMDSSDLVKEALAEDGAAKLAAAHAVFVADISAMPSIITRIFALPSLRKRPYRMVLDRDGAATERFPAQEGRVTLLHLEERSITRIEYAGSVEQVAAALGPAAAPADSGD